MTIPKDGLAQPITSDANGRVRLAKAASMTAYLLTASAMLSWVALFNGAPLVFADTISYATSAFEREVPGLFSIFYSIFILPLHRGVTFWPVVFVQGAILAHLLYLIARSVSCGRARKMDMLLIIAALCIFSSLPWISGQILPDVFTPVVLLGIFLLAFSDGELSRAEMFYVGAITIFAITTHLSHVPIAVGLILLCIGLKLIFSRSQIRIGQLTARLVVPFILALGLMIAVNWLSSREVALARNSNVFLLAKWIDEGPALSYLKESCPGAGYALCGHLKELEGMSHDELKWGSNSPFKKVGTFDELEPEARSIVRATLYAYPYGILRQAFINVGLQLSRFQAGDGVSQEFARMVAEHLGAVFGNAVGTPFIESKQGQGQLPIAEFRYLHIIGLALGAGLCLWSLLMRRSALTTELFLLYAFVFAGIVWNAVVTGALSGPYDRYLARLIWLVCFVGFLGFSYVARSDSASSEYRPTQRNSEGRTTR